MGKVGEDIARGALADQRAGQTTTALLVLGSILLPLGLLLPALKTTSFGLWSGEHSILGFGWALLQDGEYLLAAAVLGFSVAFPGFKLVWMWRLQFSRTPDAGGRNLRWLERLGKWSMADVLVLALVIFGVRDNLVFAASTLPGVYLFAAATILAMLASGRIISQLNARREAIQVIAT
ncbi:paraquat-inducible protein A [Maricaulis sp.]|uniref:paraquat-inducible protein A n=1 Tax=Maricaulis sp. TaxID=1486257 RepID=UPI003A948AD1